MKSFLVIFHLEAKLKCVKGIVHTTKEDILKNVSLLGHHLYYGSQQSPQN